MTGLSGERRVPTQARARKRYNLILDHASRLIREAGYENVTTNGIADAAGVSIGSLYQYFPNKEAILAALSERYLEDLAGIHSEVFTEDVIYLPLEVIMDRLIDPFVSFHLEHPGFTQLFLASDISADMAEANARMDEGVLNFIKEIMLVRAPDISEERAELMAGVIKAAVKAMLAAIETTSDPAKRAAQVAEFKSMLIRYIEPVTKGAGS